MSALIQTRLNRISTNFPNIPKIYPTDGVFSADTERAVRAFQRQFNLTEDGLVGQATWYRIAFIYNNVKRLSELNSEGLALSEISRQYPERLTEGMSGPGVQLLQYFLAIVGEFYDALPRWQAGQLDGIFGPQTREAVTAYQQLVGLPMTGAVDQRDVVCSALDLPVRAARPARTGMARAVRRPAGNLSRQGDARRSRAAGAAAHQHHRARLRRGARRHGRTAFSGMRPNRQSPVIQSLLGLPATGAIGPLTWEGMADLAENVLAGSQNAARTVSRLSRWRGGNVIVHRCTKTQPYFRFTDLSAAHPAG